MKVFCFYPFLEIWKILKDKESNKHSSLVVSYTILKYIPASVGYCLFVQWFFQNLQEDEQSTPHFLFVIRDIQGVRIFIFILMDLNSKKYSRFILLMAAFLCTNCAVSRHITVMSKPHDASIYIDGEYQGKGVVKYAAPKGAKSVRVSCSTDGFIYDEKEVHLSKKHQYISVSLEELMQYGSQQVQIKNH